MRYLVIFLFFFTQQCHSQIIFHNTDNSIRYLETLNDVLDKKLERSFFIYNSIIYQFSTNKDSILITRHFEYYFSPDNKKYTKKLVSDTLSIFDSLNVNVIAKFHFLIDNFDSLSKYSKIKQRLPQKHPLERQDIFLKSSKNDTIFYIPFYNIGIYNLDINGYGLKKTISEFTNVTAANESFVRYITASKSGYIKLGTNDMYKTIIYKKGKSYFVSYFNSTFKKTLEKDLIKFVMPH